MNNKIFPNDIELESAVLSSMLINPSFCERLFTMLVTNDFYLDQHRTIFDAIYELKKTGKPVDIITLKTELKNKNKLDYVGGDMYLMEIYRTKSTAANSEQYAKELKALSMRRQLITNSTKTIESCYETHVEISDIINNAEKNVLDVTRELVTDKSYSLSDLAAVGYEEIFKNVKYIKTGLTPLDNQIKGFTGGQLITIAARPGHGKSSLALQVANHIGKDAVLYSLEMKIQEHFARTIAQMTGFAYQQIVNRKLTDAESEEVKKAEKQLLDNSLTIVDNLYSFEKIAMDIKNKIINSDMKVFFIDYIGIVNKQGFDKKHEKISQMTSTLKQIAGEYNVTVVILAQINRDFEKTSGRPLLCHLRDSGAIEQDSDMVLFLFTKTEDKNIKLVNYEIIVAKSRNGGLGIIPVTFDKQRFLFTDVNYSGMFKKSKKNVDNNTDYMHN